jgi:hypothetical protein
VKTVGGSLLLLNHRSELIDDRRKRAVPAHHDRRRHKHVIAQGAKLVEDLALLRGEKL